MATLLTILHFLHGNPVKKKTSSQHIPGPLSGENPSEKPWPNLPSRRISQFFSPAPSHLWYAPRSVASIASAAATRHLCQRPFASVEAASWIQIDLRNPNELSSNLTYQQGNIIFRSLEESKNCLKVSEVFTTRKMWGGFFQPWFTWLEGSSLENSPL